MGYSEESHKAYIEEPYTEAEKKEHKKRDFVKQYAYDNKCSVSWVYKLIQYGKLKVK